MNLHMSPTCVNALKDCDCSDYTVYLFQKVTHGVERSCVRGVGFDATCSLVVLDQSFQPVSVTQDGE